MAKNTSISGIFKRFSKLLGNYKQEIYHIYLYAAFNGLIDLSLPLGIQAIVNFITMGEGSTSWILLILFVALGVFITGVLQIVQLGISEKIQQNLFSRMAFEFAYRMPHIGFETAQKYHLPELANRFFDTLSVQKSLSKVLFDFSKSSLQILFGLLLLSFYHPAFIAFGFALLLILYILMYFTFSDGLRTSLDESKNKYALAHWLEEVARNVITFKLAGESSLPLNKTDYYTTKYLKARKKHFKILVIQYFSMISFKTVVAASLLIMGGLLFFRQEINLGQFIAAEIVILSIINAVEKLILSLENVYDLLTALEKLGSITDLSLERDGANEHFFETDHTKIAHPLGFSLSVRNLTYNFDDALQPTINNLSFDVAQGERICITGSENAGKSTLLNLLSGFYTHYTGSISYNDVPLSNINLKNLRRCVGDTLSQATIFEGTVTENISVGSPQVNFNDIQNAIAVVGLTDWVASLPQGYNTQLMPQGKRLSNSLVRKIITARMLAENPRLFLIDRLTENMTFEEKEGLFNTLFAPNQTATIIAISQDADFAARCNRVLVMHQGSIVADDTFQNIAQNPNYASLFTSKLV